MVLGDIRGIRRHSVSNKGVDRELNLGGLQIMENLDKIRTYMQDGLDLCSSWARIRRGSGNCSRDMCVDTDN